MGILTGGPVNSTQYLLKTGSNWRIDIEHRGWANKIPLLLVIEVWILSVSNGLSNAEFRTGETSCQDNVPLYTYLNRRRGFLCKFMT